MKIHDMTRRDFSVGLASLFPALTAVAAKSGWDPGISNKAEAIHQVVAFRAPPKRIYEVLLVLGEHLPAPGVNGQALAAMFASQSGTLFGLYDVFVGGAFSLFSSQIKGRQLDLVPGELIVQAWRSEGWKPHLFSIARFALTEQGSGTQLVFDHAGFPVGQAQHLAAGWNDHYWAPLEKFLG